MTISFINIIEGLALGIIISFTAGIIYLKYFRKRSILPFLFYLNDYNSQQLAKLLGNRVLNVLKKNEQLSSVNEDMLPLEFQSQWCEDIMLYEYFKGKKNGFFLEIGAFDGVKLSNTYFFECIGWTGILVEPQPKQFEMCKKNRPYSQCINTAISLNPGEVELNVVQTDNYQTWSFIGKDNGDLKKFEFETKKIMVPTSKISDLLPGNPKIDFISIDVEGMELEILKTIDLRVNGPELILLENNKSEVQNYLAQFGYQLVFRTWINYFYSKDKDAFKDISIWDMIDIQILG